MSHTDQITPLTARPAQPYIRVDDSGAWVEGRRCTVCDARTAAVHLACPACGARGSIETYRAPTTGKLHAYSIVRRSYPGVPVPFVSAIIDLDDGLTLKGNLINVAAEPEALPAGLPVRMVFDDAMGRTDKDGASYVAFFFEPA
ncbi:Zn-ribbon domain-containing OB-fold protein [Brevundimonas sp.]|jgi:uncharacterized OB-fold protein|uniref:Zn-ribbon domain-containing OB-fold protein n=1 Tax=Brevundimonas sp. TaxID=1871086 RepID=UPI0037846CBE